MAQVPRSMLFRFMKKKSSFLFILFSFTALIIYNMTSISISSSSSSSNSKLSSNSNSNSNSVQKPRFRNNIMPEDIDDSNQNKLNFKKGESNGKNNNQPNINSIQNDELYSDLFNSKLIKTFISELYSLRPNDEILKENPLEFSNFDIPDHIISYSFLESIATIPKNWINEIKSKHSKVINLINSKINDFNLISKNDGAVIIGGYENDLTWLALISTRLFRRAGGVLPIEVMLPTYDDYIKDKEICDLYLPQLNAKCIIMKDLLESSKIDNGNIKINSYISDNFNLIKRELAILLSKFENVLYLSPENVMLKPMESTIFEKKFYNDYGLLVWGDYGPRFTLPSFYEIANIEIKNTRSSIYGLPLTDSLINDNSNNNKFKNLDNEMFKNQINYHDLLNSLPYKQSDASEIIINKRKHLNTLFLSMYYNLNGPKVYYILLTGKYNGEHGSKETILAASHVLNNNYYLVKTNVEGNGYWYDGKFFGVSMLQFDAIVDFFSYEGFINKFSNRRKGIEITQSKFQKWLKESSERRSPLFLNINNPPLKPIELIKDNIVIKENGDRIKLISDSSYFDPLFETDIWRVMNDYICYLSLDSNYVNSKLGKPNSKQRDSFCKGEMKEHLLWIASLNDN